MIYLLDTSAFSALMRADACVAAWLSSVSIDDRVVICAISRGEILFGLERLSPGRRRDDLEQKAQKMFAVLPRAPIPAAARRRGLPLDENDLWIAATALAMDATLLAATVIFG